MGLTPSYQLIQTSLQFNPFLFNESINAGFVFAGADEKKGNEAEMEWIDKFMEWNAEAQRSLRLITPRSFNNKPAPFTIHSINSRIDFFLVHSACLLIPPYRPAAINPFN